MEIAEAFELQEGRTSKRVHRDGVGYDLLSISIQEERFIEVKGISESWKTYNWQPLFRSEVEALNKYPEKFFLYIIHFEETANLSNYKLFVIHGTRLLNDGFRITPESFSLRPISQRRLAPYAVSVEKLVGKCAVGT